MASDAVALVRSKYEAFEQGDLDSGLRDLAQDAELVDPDLPEGGTFHGPAGIRRFVENWFGAFSDLTIEIERIEAKGDRVAVMLHQRGMSASGVPVELRDGHVWTVVGGQIQRIELFLTHEAALAAL
jgi:ketosteroid isomerase-like protein